MSTSETFEHKHGDKDLCGSGLHEIADAIKGLTVAIQVGHVFPTKTDLENMEKRLTELLHKIMATEVEISAALSLVDAATNKIAANLLINSEVEQQISDEIDALVAAVKPGTGLSDAQFKQLQDFATKLQTASDTTDAQVTVLKAIASKGVANPVPIPVPPTPASPV